MISVSKKRKTKNSYLKGRAEAQKDIKADRRKNKVKCAYTSSEIFKSFIEDVKAVEEFLPD